MSKKIKSRFSFSLIASITLHVGLIAVLGYSAWQYISPDAGDIKGQSIDAVMVDSSIMTEQYQRQLQHKLSSQKVKQQQQEQIEKQAKEMQQQQLAEQQRMKDFAKESLLAKEKQQKEQEALIKAQQEAERTKSQLMAQQKQAELEKQRALAEAEKAKQEAELTKAELAAQKKQAELEKQQALAEAEKAKQEAEKQKKILDQERIKAEKEKQDKIKAAQEAQRKAKQEQEQQQALDDILGGLTSAVPKSQQGISTDETNQYKLQVYNAINNKFINPDKLYSGQNCVLKILLASDGVPIKVTAEEGDPALCREAISAATRAVFPKPKNNAFYQQVKNITIDFKPK